MIKTKIFLFDSGHEFPKESLYLGPLGWTIEKPKNCLYIHTNSSIDNILTKLSMDHGNILGNGELHLALLDETKKPHPINTTLMVFGCFIVFIPEK